MMVNRARRRQILRDEKKKSKKRTYIMTDETLEGVHDSEHKRASLQSMAYTIGIVVELMHDEFNWEEQECNWLAQEVIKRYNKAPSLNEVNKKTLELSGIRIEMEDDGRERNE